MTSFSKWLPGGHIRFCGFWMAWFRQRNSSLLWNFSFKFHVHVLCGCRQKPNYSQLSRFQNDCLVILNNVQLQSTHCHPLPWGGGILVDHWSTISSCSWNQNILGELCHAMCGCKLDEQLSFPGNRQRNTFVKLLKCCMYGMYHIVFFWK